MPSPSIRRPAATSVCLASALTAVLVLGACTAPDAEAARAALIPAAGAQGRPAPDSALLARADLGRIQGNPQAKVWMIMISDFECPYCAQWHRESYEAIRSAYVETGKIRMAYVNLPLSIHRNARPAAEVAMCAAAQGKFWPAQDAIFRTQGEWKSRDDAPRLLEAAVVAAGANAAELRACLAGGKLRPLIDADADRASRAGASSTPSFLIGGKLMMGAQPVGAFRQALDEALAAAR